MFKKNIIFILLIILSIVQINSVKDKSNSKTETCDPSKGECYGDKPNYINEKGEEVYINNQRKIIYSDIFKNLPYLISTNNSDETTLNFDFRTNRRMISVISKYDIVVYPKDRFIGKQQGNFLHFFHLAYSKRLPLYFDVDQIIYPYIEITKDLIQRVIKNGLYKILQEFFINVINYGKKENYEKGILLYFSIGLKFLNKSQEVVHNDVCEKLVNNILNIEKGEFNHVYNFTLMNHVRSIDKMSFQQRRNILKGEEKLERISDCLRFYQNFHFELEKEFYIVYKIGNLIYKSGQDKIFNEIKKFIKYIFNEEEFVMNPLDIYLYISNYYRNYTMSNETANHLYEKISDNLIKETSLEFMNNYTFMKDKEKVKFIKERNSHTSLFFYPYLLEEFISYTLLNHDKYRYYPSYFEYVDIVHHGKLMEKTIYDRFKGNKIEGGRLLQFRDMIDMSKEFNYTKKIVKRSMRLDKDRWIDSYENSFNYLLNIVGLTDKNWEKNDDKEIKLFNSLVGAYVHFKKETALFKQKTNIIYAENGTLIDLYFNPNVKFYTELEKISTIFQKHLLDLINYMEDKNAKIKLEQTIERRMKRLFTSYENILKGIELQNDVTKKETEFKKLKESMFHYDKKKKRYKGWYVDLYKDNDGDINYDLDIYLFNYFMARPLNKINFKGIIDYVSMNFPEFGLINVGDGYYEPKRMFLFSSYLGNEYPILWTENVNFKGLKELIMTRR